jgi:protein-S-isoprenylcysteine O-methyltransferase Ste14
METFWKILIPTFSVAYFLLVFVVRSLVLMKKTGVNPFTFGKGDSAHDYAGRVYKFMTLGTWAMITLYIIGGKWYTYLMPIPYLEMEWLRWCGAGMALFSIIWVSIAQYHMGKSWRIGIDRMNATELVTGGIFGISRNPIFLGVVLAYFGTFLMIPNLMSAILAVTSWIILNVQVRLEEEFLVSTKGQKYEDYKNNVRRWI